MKRHNVERQPVAGGDGTTHLYILLRIAVATLTHIKADAYVKQMQGVALLNEPVNSNSAVNASGNQHSYIHYRPMLGLNLLKLIAFVLAVAAEQEK